ncbi:MAG: class I SAM-dependent methyltransferase [Candidatus Binatia bacterium]
MSSKTPYTEQYYARHGLAGDRVALWFYARLLRRLRPAGGRLLDFGCGTGHLLRRLSEHFEAYGYDASPEARSACRLTAPDAVVLEEWESLPPGHFQAIVALHTLEHLSHPRPVIEGLARRLAPGGVLLFVVPNPGGIGHRLKRRHWFAYRDPTHVSVLSRGEWLTIARRSGLRVLWVRGDGLWDPPYVPLLPVGVQRVLFGAPAGVQIALPLRRPFLPDYLGECLIVAAERPDHSSAPPL